MKSRKQPLCSLHVSISLTLPLAKEGVFNSLGTYAGQLLAMPVSVYETNNFSKTKSFRNPERVKTKTKSFSENSKVK